ncbi:MAG: LamG-like jellyroll fold domain-containing protein [Planctomycetota bacterium]|jgi:hypothetical protein
MTNLVVYDGTDWITSTVAEAKATIMFWATSGGIWRSYIKTDLAEYINGLTNAFDESFFYNRSGADIGWGDGFTGNQTLQRIWQSEQTNVGVMHWDQAVRLGWSQYDFDNRSAWSNTFAVHAFSYDSPLVADTSHAGDNHATKPGGAANPTHDGDAINGWYNFDGSDYLTMSYPSTPPAYTKADITLSCWFRVENWVDSAGIVFSHSVNEQTGFYLGRLGIEGRKLVVRMEIDNSTYSTAATNILADSVWHFVVISFNGNSGNRPILMVNGADIREFGPAGGGAFAGGITDNFKIGWWDVAAGRKFQGDIDEVRFSEVYTTPEEMTNLYNETKWLFGLGDPP